MASTRRFLTGKLSVPECIAPPTPPEGTTDHSALANRDLPDQHPIEAITGLLETLNKLKDDIATLDVGNEFAPGMNMFASYIGTLPTVNRDITVPNYLFIGPTNVGKTVYGIINGESDVKGRLFLCKCVVKETSTSDIGIDQYVVTIKSVKEIPDVESSAPIQNGVPTGTIITSLLYTIPDGYLNCNGEVYNIADYPDLAAAFVTSFGKSNQFGGDGETTFAVPNLSDTFLYGVHFENQQMQHHIGETGGEETHTLTIDEMPGHHHSLMETNESGTMHMHAVTTEYVNSTLTAGAIGSAGGNTAHNNLPPYFRIAYYIKY